MTITDPEMGQPRRQEFRETHPRQPWGTELPGVYLNVHPDFFHATIISCLEHTNNFPPTSKYVFLPFSNPQNSYGIFVDNENLIVSSP